MLALKPDFDLLKRQHAGQAQHANIPLHGATVPVPTCCVEGFNAVLQL
jgi:hypothetical protein